MNVSHNAICYTCKFPHEHTLPVYMAEADNCLSLSVSMLLLSYCTIIPLTVVPVLFALITHAAFKAFMYNCALHIPSYYVQYSTISITY